MLDGHEKLTPEHYRRRGEKMAVRLFQDTAKNVPAYKAFLEENGVNPRKIKSFADLTKVPVVTKENYLRKYPLESLVREGNWVKAVNSLSLSSGSTGKPFFWPISDATAEVGEFYYEMLLRYMYKAHEKSTLAVVCYTMGTWMAGTYTYNALFYLANEYPLTVISPGLNINEALRIVTEMGPHYDQVLLLGYGPFLKDVIDTGTQNGVDWKKLNTKLKFAGEPFNESWRQYMLELVGSEHKLSDAGAAYAASDAGIMAVETPTSLMLSQLLTENENLGEELFDSVQRFGARRSPTLQQYDPSKRFFEVNDTGELLVTGDAAIPLVRYNILDQGGIFNYDELSDDITNSIEEGLRAQGEPLIRMPFVYVYGRRHNAATIYAVTIWPENIRAGLEDSEVRHLLSGKHRMQTRYDANQDQYLFIQVELAQGVKPTRTQKAKIRKRLIARLLELNSEYRELVRLKQSMGSEEQIYPELEYLPYGDPTFKPGAKLAAATTAGK
jgi:phenylacetate-CoA ligase